MVTHNRLSYVTVYMVLGYKCIPYIIADVPRDRVHPHATAQGPHTSSPSRDDDLEARQLRKGLQDCPQGQSRDHDLEARTVASTA